MARATKDPKRALERIGPLVPRIIVTRDRQQVRIQRADGAGEAPATKTTIRALAFLADLVRHTPEAEAIRARVAWHGPVPFRGVKGWEREALEWLCITDERPVSEGRSQAL